MLNSTQEVISSYVVQHKGDDTMMKEDYREIIIEGRILPVNLELWRAWTGLRFVNGEEHHGPAYLLGSDTPYDGARVCSCDLCLSHAKPQFKSN